MVVYPVGNLAEATAWSHTALGAHPSGVVQDVGGGILLGAVPDPFGNLLGVIQNPHFALPG